MKLINYIEYIRNININQKYLILIVLTILTLFLGKVIISIIKRFLVKIKNNKKQYNILQFIKILVNITEILIIYLLWESNIKNVITLISFISAAITLSLKDLVFNFFSGIYIKLNKSFKVEDRIEINKYKGDVINLGIFNFEILETTEEHGNQSSGIIVEIPNSYIFLHPLKNLTKGFKYIWDEIELKIKLDCDIINNKKIIYNIKNNIELIKNVPNKMKKELKNNTTYRMYYNNYEPVIYTELDNNIIKLKVRYLVNPKKSRIIKSKIYNEIIKEYKSGNINLYE